MKYNWNMSMINVEWMLMQQKCNKRTTNKQFDNYPF